MVPGRVGTLTRVDADFRMATVLPTSLRFALADAPHRALFSIGACNVLAAMAWWLAHLVGWSSAALPGLPAAWMHGYLMQYQVLPAFIFGFLLTVFPRWLGIGEAGRWHYLPVALGLLLGQVATLGAAFGGSPLLLYVGWLNTAAGWIGTMAVLAHWMREAPSGDVHARSAFAALLVGFLGVASFGVWLHGGSPVWLHSMNVIGGIGFLMPIYFTVAHRVFPFFAGNVVKGYLPWRPVWLLGALWALTLVHLLAPIAGMGPLQGLADAGLAGLGVFVLWRWWPRGEAPPLLRVLFIGLAWWPFAMGLYAWDALAPMLGLGHALGRLPLHALAVGCFGTLLVAMVTRVTAGHSGRPLRLGPIGAFAFVGMNAVALLRIVADLVPDPLPWWQASAAGWLLAFLPWVLRNLWIYLVPRADGRPG